MPPRTRDIRGTADIRDFFDQIAPAYRDCHGQPQRQLEHRLTVIRRLLDPCRRGLLVEIGCGTGMHVFALAAEFDRALGIDLSPNMVAEAEGCRRGHPLAERIAFQVDAAEELRTIRSEQADAAICVGALEHMPDKLAVLRQVRRILKPGGVFACLTPDADYCWYRHIAPRLGIETRHLSTDRRVNRAELREVVEQAELRAAAIAPWTFVPRGDMPNAWAHALAVLAFAGEVFHVGLLRGGLGCRAEKP